MKKGQKLSILIFLICILLGVNTYFIYRINETMQQHNELHSQQEKCCDSIHIVGMETMDVVEIKRNEYLTKLNKLQTIEDKQERFVAYKKLYDEYLEWVDLPETIYNCFSEEEILLIQKVVETEAHQCDFDSKVNIANVIFNRWISGEFKESITEIITSPGQFAYGRSDISESTILAVEYAFLNEDTTQGALYFHSNTKTNTFNGAKYIFSDMAAHHFYR